MFTPPEAFARWRVGAFCTDGYFSKGPKMNMVKVLSATVLPSWVLMSMWQTVVVRPLCVVCALTVRSCGWTARMKFVAVVMATLETPYA